MNRMQNFKNGLIKENPVFGLYLGLCSTLAITTSLNNAIGMGVAVICVLIVSNMIMFRNPQACSRRYPYPGLYRHHRLRL